MVGTVLNLMLYHPHPIHQRIDQGYGLKCYMFWLKLYTSVYVLYTEPKKKLSRDFNGTVSTYVYINSFYSYLLLHNNLKSIHQSSFTVRKLSISLDFSISFEVGVDSIFFGFSNSMPTASIANSLAATTH